MPSKAHAFFAVAFVENLSLKEIAAAFPEARGSLHELRLTLVLDVARDRRLVLLELAIVFLIVVELLLSLLRMSRSVSGPGDERSGWRYGEGFWYPYLDLARRRRRRWPCTNRSCPKRPRLIDRRRDVLS